VLEKIDDRIDLLEEQLISNPEKEVLKVKPLFATLLRRGK